MTNIGGNSTSVIDTVTGTVVDTVGVGSTPIGVAVTPDGGEVYVADSNSGTASVIDTATNTVTATVPVGSGPYAVAFAPAPTSSSDIDVDVTARPNLGILVPYLTYTVTARALGPDAVTTGTVTATLPPGATATSLSPGCTTATGTVTCSYGTIATGAAASKTFRVPLHLLSLGTVKVTGTRTASSPTDPNPANDRATATCTVVSILLATCA